MKKIDDLINKATQPVRNYIRTKVIEEYKPDIARFKMKIYFRDGNKIIRFGYDKIKKQFDRSQKNDIYDEWEGLMKLIRLSERWKSKIKTAQIYASSQKIPYTKWQEKLYYNIPVLFITGKNRIMNPYINFTESNKLDLEKIRANKKEIEELFNLHFEL